MNYSTKTGAMIRSHRKAKNWPLRTLARAIDSTPQQLSRIETGKRRLGLDDLKRIADFLELPVSALLPD